MIGFAADHLTAVEADMLADMGLPRQHRVKPGESLGSALHGTNPPERLNGEVKRRSGVVGVSPSRAALPPSASRPWRPDRATDAAQERRSHTTTWDMTGCRTAPGFGVTCATSVWRVGRGPSPSGPAGNGCE